jgi:hypothetical protein
MEEGSDFHQKGGVFHGVGGGCFSRTQTGESPGSFNTSLLSYYISPSYIRRRHRFAGIAGAATTDPQASFFDELVSLSLVNECTQSK